MRRATRQSHWARYGRPLLLAAWFAWCSDPVHAALSKTGFLVVAPDRGFLGNQEIRAVFEDFKTTYAAASLMAGNRHCPDGADLGAAAFCLPCRSKTIDLIERADRHEADMNPERPRP